VQINIIILSALVLASLWTVMTRSLLRSAIGLALTSAILTIMMFRLNSPLAAVFELSVCAGLIPVLFISTISLTYPQTKIEMLQHMRERLARFWFLPLIIIVLTVVLVMTKIKSSITLPAAENLKDVRIVMWNFRQLDIMGQVIILLTGVFGVVVLFKERAKK
jgi:NADH-quinone oxidoreductase subunit J